MQIDTIQTTPFWGESSSPAGGRDPLAIQNSSVFLYSTLIVGITNVTLRIRYIGFYCWILNAIARKIAENDGNKIDSFDEQRKYIRRAELLLAYIMVIGYKSIQGISGSDFAARNKDADACSLNLSQGADLFNDKVPAKSYWRNKLGIFGQYYLGVLSQLNLVCSRDESHNTFRTTTKGDELSQAFEASISDKARNLFIDAVFQGNASKSSINSLKEFALQNIPEGEELNFYREIMMEQDYPEKLDVVSKNRRESIILLLEFIHGRNDDNNPVYLSNVVREFLKSNFQAVVSDFDKISGTDKCRTAWFLYEFNELVHTAFESFHFCLLNSLPMEKNTPVPFHKVMQDILSGIKDLCNSSDYKLVSDFEQQDLYAIYDNMFKAKGPERAFYATELLFALHSVLKDHYSEMTGFSLNGIRFNRIGYAPALLTELVGESSDISIKKFVEETVYRAINSHISSSYKKSSLGQGLVHNYMIEENAIWKLRDTTPIRTSPRLANVVRYMIDIRWVKQEQDNHLTITDDGLKLLENV